MSNPESYHLIGIGGAGMSVVAELLHARGATITGSDALESKNVEHLRGLGITCFVGHDASQVPPESTVVVSTAVRESNPELSVARARGQKVIHRSQALAIAAQGMDFIAVAGAHGKTTTSGMLASALSGVGTDPSFAVGGVVTGFDTGAHLGGSKVFIAEADESDKSFLNYTPRIALVTNVEPDHLDNYGSREAFEQAFVDFAGKIVDGGLLIVCSDDEGAARLGKSYAQTLGGRVASYGTKPVGVLDELGIWHAENHAVISNTNLSAEGASATVQYLGRELELHLKVGGAHNLLNAAGALLVGIELGVDADQMAQGLSAFVGTGRRFEFKGEVGGRRLFDDYAHHPSEVVATLKQARVEARGGRVLVLFQPHLYSRTKNFADRFAEAFCLADQVYFTDIFAAREDPMPGVTSGLIADRVPGSKLVPDMTQAAMALADQAQPGDLCITMGAGSVTSMGDVILSRWNNG
ncbi:MAG: UDP-N-acetylmuramate--L-alanine ligase [Actinomycetaceae bacterium]|nr:UDP-N-acetylmuramate--L-alanine ligase [Actinomycetaceae bacterium]